MTLSQVLGLVITVITVVGLLGAAWVVLRSKLATTTSELWKEEADALRARLETVEEAEQLCNQRLTIVEATNRVLSDQVSGTTAIRMLSDQLTRQHADVVRLLGGGRKSDGIGND